MKRKVLTKRCVLAHPSLATTGFLRMSCVMGQQKESGALRMSQFSASSVSSPSASLPPSLSLVPFPAHACLQLCPKSAHTSMQQGTCTHF